MPVDTTSREKCGINITQVCLSIYKYVLTVSAKPRQKDDFVLISKPSQIVDVCGGKKFRLFVRLDLSVTALVTHTWAQ